MADIYEYNNDFSPTKILEDIDAIAYELSEEQSKPDEERDVKREKELIYAQFIRGLRLSTGNIIL